MQLRAWTLSKLIVLVLIGAYVGLFIDLRYEHVDIVRHNWHGWIPIAYCGAMVLVGLAALALWEHGGRLALQVGFACGFGIGALGFWYHNHGHIARGVLTELSAWTAPIHHRDIPPHLAPLTFAGLSFLGLLATLKRLECPPERVGERTDT